MFFHDWNIMHRLVYNNYTPLKNCLKAYKYKFKQSIIYHETIIINIAPFLTHIKIKPLERELKNNMVAATFCLVPILTTKA